MGRGIGRRCADGTLGTGTNDVVSVVCADSDGNWYAECFATWRNYLNVRISVCIAKRQSALESMSF